MVYNRNDYLSTSPWLKSQFLGGTPLNKEDIDFLTEIGAKKTYTKGAVLLDMGNRVITCSFCTMERFATPY
ncbi:hypothetical protein N752_12010 [Desulforamulus aquiferis]|nr:hypothetical protein N752_12010 [Desulforamulus aquiferis]